MISIVTNIQSYLYIYMSMHIIMSHVSLYEYDNFIIILNIMICLRLFIDRRCSHDFPIRSSPLPVRRRQVSVPRRRDLHAHARTSARAATVSWGER